MLTIVLFLTRTRIYLTHAHLLRPRLLLCTRIRIQPYRHLRFTLPHPTVHLRLDRLLFNLGIRELGVDCAINVRVVVLSPSCSLRRLLAQFAEALEESLSRQISSSIRAMGCRLHFLSDLFDYCTLTDCSINTCT